MSKNRTSMAIHPVASHLKGIAITAAFTTLCSLSSNPVQADESHMPSGSTTAVSGGGHNHVRADAHAPIGVMGEHMHKKGGWMLSYRYMRMDMEGNRIGENKVSPESIVTTVPNRFFGAPGQPKTLRIVPTEMTMDMHMLGAMYAPTDNVTLMFMLPMVRKSMDHLTFAGGAGTNIRGGFTTVSQGVGDARLSALVRLYDDANNHFHLNLGLSAPTGSIDERDNILTPMGARPEVRLPYAMQIGTGTWDLHPGLTYLGKSNALSWGAQYRAEIRLESENDEGYSWGDKHALTAWVAYQWAPWISTSVRLDAMTQEAIDGIDAQIAGPVQTADPDNYGGERVDLLFGVNLAGQSGALHGHRLAFEFGVPVHQDLNGPQMETDWLFTLGWQKAF